MRINKKIYNYIDYELSNYKYYEQKIKELRTDIIDSSPNPPDRITERKFNIGSNCR
jgi:hypothetical protein